MQRKYWVSIHAPFQELPITSSVRIAWLPINTVVDVDEAMSDSEWYFVEWNNRKGWVKRGYLESYVEGYPVNPFVIEHQTPEKNDFEQYVFTNGVKQVNFCGQLCISHLLNIGLTEVLKNWKEKKLPLWKSIFGGGRARGTGYGELQDILTAFNVPSLPLTHVTKEPLVNRSLYTPERLMKLVKTGGVIAGVKMDAGTGRLRGQGIGHWIVVKKVIPERTGYGLVEIYNPAPHRDEVYSWQEFIATAVVPTGVFVSEEFLENESI